MERSEVKDKFVSVKERIKQLENKEYSYHTEGRHYPGVGIITDMNTKSELTSAFAAIKAKKSDLSEANKELGFDDEEDVVEEVAGISIDLWLEDIKTRVENLKDEAVLEKLRRGEQILDRNLSADDKFELDMKELEGLI